ncbi:TetR family transcriptional regulator [Agreia sp. VKM Ac-1783]|uniref:TetR family transcriptional regulator n=1 Tax=Agreia sp. VKM Ac-1783 TaxID=1938889 RepID=UPI000A2AEF18|nr:TetR family transcriptional regulator [Agreia sp. VKM Ac-1783]SMQ68200.1 transcriptional regulator, TetR family [Agreia sp. VKM Ac-1783]
MRSDGEATRRRILDAARTEFAAFGLAGARVDRIAAAASASKERLYAYFGDKVSLFQQVLELNQHDVADAIPIDVNDLPEFVGRVFDHTITHPEHLRMLHWARLEGISALLVDEDRSRLFSEGELLRRAQLDGLIDDEWEPEDLVAMLFGLASTWASAPGIFADSGVDVTPEILARRRASAVRAAARLVQPSTTPRSGDRARS